MERLSDIYSGFNDVSNYLEISEIEIKISNIYSLYFSISDINNSINDIPK